MTDTAISVENLSKLYKIGACQKGYKTLRESVMGILTAPMQRFKKIPQSAIRNPQSESIWALKDVSFEIKQGEVVGIIGRNGAGKTTLLKILSRITEPTDGRAVIRGRVGSLLEVGTGFHPELTGRENIYLNGAILGMRITQIGRKFDEIVDFAEIEKFIDTPVKRYSSGMFVRLAFAVAAHLEPEILLVDEVLAVGDAAFQKKCFGKMGEVSSEGRTVLLVSHNMQAISTLTHNSLLLSGGHCVFKGPTPLAISEYLRENRKGDLIYVDHPCLSEPRITHVELRTSEPNNTHVNGLPMDVVFEINVPAAINGASLSFQACNFIQQPVFHIWTFDSERPMCREPGTYQLICRIPKIRLYMGRYTLTVHFSECAGGQKFQTIEGICPFEVVMYGRKREFKWAPGTCTYLEEFNWQIEKLDSV